MNIRIKQLRWVNSVIHLMHWCFNNHCSSNFICDKWCLCPWILLRSDRDFNKIMIASCRAISSHSIDISVWNMPSTEILWNLNGGVRIFENYTHFALVNNELLRPVHNWPWPFWSHIGDTEHKSCFCDEYHVVQCGCTLHACKMHLNVIVKTLKQWNNGSVSTRVPLPN